MHEKQRRDRTVLGALHGMKFDDETSSMRVDDYPSFDGGARGFETGWTPAPWHQPIPYSTGDGWITYEIEDGIELIYPWMERR
jgi:hypothetical protein